ncbi:serine protease [Hydrogenophaga sp. 2FB]|uniref:trypsin-like serine peptidase n=1 Tax=Hydrogenophaga sp. 2FB TaxID=2502187 RepID=UPI001484F051|nr:serine protease [Hydrogenophaga sp. 2FB]
MISQGVVSALHHSVCALGVRLVDQFQHEKEPTAAHFEIIGTGFAVSDCLVLTNRHVLEAMRAYADTNGYTREDFYAQFVTPKADGWSLHFCRIGAVGVCSYQDEDIGLVHMAGLPTLGHRAVSFRSPATLHPGCELALLGYADGVKLQQSNHGAVFQEDLYRFGPILQQGYLSAIAPMHGCGQATRLLLDIRTTGGLSGSPVFLPNTGEVVGVHFASNKTTTAFAVPLDEGRVRTYVENFQLEVAKWIESGHPADSDTSHVTN